MIYRISLSIHKEVYIIAGLQNGYEKRISIETNVIAHRERCCQGPVSVRGDNMTTFDKILERSASMVSGLYFKRTMVDFGDVVVGSLSRLKAELCNSTDHMVSSLHTVYDTRITCVDDDPSSGSSFAICSSSQRSAYSSAFICSHSD